MIADKRRAIRRLRPHHIERFKRLARAYAEVYFYLGHVHGAINQCGRTARGFISSYGKTVNQSRRLPLMHTICLRGHRRRFPHWHRWHAEQTKTPSKAVHIIVRWGDWTVDFTRRQFDPKAPFPFFQHIDDVRKDWKIVRAE